MALIWSYPCTREDETVWSRGEGNLASPRSLSGSLGSPNLLTKWPWTFSQGLQWPLPSSFLLRVNYVTNRSISSPSECLGRCCSQGCGQAVCWSVHVQEPQASFGARWNHVWGKKSQLWTSSFVVGPFCWNPVRPTFLDNSLNCQASMKVYMECKKIYILFNS